MHVSDFWTELQNPEVSLTLLKSDSTTDDLKPKILETNKGQRNVCGRISFRIVINAWIF